jgi:hypothetical protein
VARALAAQPRRERTESERRPMVTNTAPSKYSLEVYGNGNGESRLIRL